MHAISFLESLILGLLFQNYDPGKFPKIVLNDLCWANKLDWSFIPIHDIMSSMRSIEKSAFLQGCDAFGAGIFGDAEGDWLEGLGEPSSRDTGIPPPRAKTKRVSSV